MRVYALLVQVLRKKDGVEMEGLRVKGRAGENGSDEFRVDRGIWPAISKPSEIINRLFEIVMGFRLPCAFDKTGSIDRNVVGSPMTPGTRRRVGIVANQDETLGLRGCIKALQSWRSRAGIATVQSDG